MKPINLTTPINQLGFGIVGLNTLRWLRRLGYEVSLWPLGDIDCPSEFCTDVQQALRARQAHSRHAPSLRIAPPSDLAQHVGSGRRVGITYFERDRLTADEIRQLQQQDVVVASSHWMAQLLVRQIRGPQIVIASPGIDRDIFVPLSESHAPLPLEHLDSAAKDLKGDLRPADESGPTTTYLVVGKWEVRKGHDILPAVFQRALTPHDAFKLVLLTVNPFLTQAQHTAWCQRFARLGSKVEFHHRRLTDQRDVARAMAQADCGVFLSRAEGWNLDAAEMLAMGKHIVITNYSAHTESVDCQNAWLVDIDKLEPARDDYWFDGWGRWAHLGEPQVAQAATHVRAIHQLKQSQRLPPNWAGQQSMARFTWQAFVERILAAAES